MRCNSGRSFNNPTIVSVFSRSTNQRLFDEQVTLTKQEDISIKDPDPCISDPPTVCYVVGYYNFTLSLPESASGYLLSSQVNYRVANINNLQSGYNNVGATYTAEIPGTSSEPTGAVNNSAKFTGSDLVIVCANNKFEYSFAASDPDGDQLRYSFCGAYVSGTVGVNNVPPASPPYTVVPYGNGFSSSQPLGENVQINALTGLITGIAPPSGKYVVTVCVDEIRNGLLIARQRKDLQINIAPCNVTGAVLEPAYILCRDSKTLEVSNLSTSPLIHSYYWQINNAVGEEVFSTTDPQVNYTFADTGTYSVRLAINRGEACKDSTLSIARVYPGFKPDFNFTGICYTKPTAFTDATTSVYGTPSSWAWDFGTGAESAQRNPIYTYASEGTRNVQLTVTNTVGCVDKITKPVTILKDPPIHFGFTDTLICVGDSTKLIATGTGTFSWSPTTNMINANTGTPTVAPRATTSYNVVMNDNGCVNSGSVKVRVTDHVDLKVMNDTTICRGDTIQLKTVSDGFRFAWSPAQQIINPTAKSPLAFTKNNFTSYSVTANIGSCVASAKVGVSTIPYPVVNAGADTTICFNTAAFLRGTTNATSVKWSPVIGLANPTAASTAAAPTRTTKYALFGYANLGCPKPGIDEVLVSVSSPILASAGSDTSVIIDQPLQLQATGGVRYFWIPSTGLSSPNIANPTARYSEPSSGIHYIVQVADNAGCMDSAYLTVKVFATTPSIFVPTAFTPNNDRKNDELRPVAVGIKQIEFFSIYNRWGQLVFTTKINGRGWDGTINGIPQAQGTYVWMVKATDYTNAPYFQKGTVVLIR